MAFIVYKDLNQFSPNTVGYVENAQAVYQAVYNVLTTRKGERLFYPEFGILLEDELFELNDEVTQSRVKNLIKIALEEFEPRVNLDFNASIVEPDADKGLLKVSLIFSIEGIEGQLFEITETLQR